MTMEKFTTKAQTAVQEAASLANRSDSGTLEAVHLARTLLDQEQGMITSILQRLEAPAAAIRTRWRDRRLSGP
jgi:ATP-dependent Clp protease ATP-binding subunit ClpB